MMGSIIALFFLSGLTFRTKSLRHDRLDSLGTWLNALG